MLASSAVLLAQRQFGIQPRQFLGAVAHALFQRRIGALQRLGRLERRRDVGEGDDQPAARHPVGAHLDHHVPVRQPFQIGLAFGGVGGEPHVQQRLRRRRTGGCIAPMNSRISRSGIADLHERAAAAREFRRTAGSSRSAAVRRSNTAMPCRTWLSAVCSISRLKCSAAWESSSSFSAALAETVRLRSSSDITSRDDAAPIDEAIRCSACCSNSKSAGAAGSRRCGGRARRPRTIAARGRGRDTAPPCSDVLHRHRGAPAPERRRHRRQRRSARTGRPAAVRSRTAGAPATVRHRSGC